MAQDPLDAFRIQGRSLLQWLTETALRSIPVFKYAVGAAAILLLCGAVLRVLPNPRIAFVASVGLLVLAAILFLMQRAAADPLTAQSLRRVIVLVFWAVAVTFVALLALFVAWIFDEIFPSSRSQFTPGESDVLAVADEIDALGGKWESALREQHEPGVGQLSTKASVLAARILEVDPSELDPQFQVWQQRHAATGFLIACSTAELKKSLAQAKSYCLSAQMAAQSGLDTLARIRHSHGTDARMEYAWTWLQSTQQQDRILRTQAVIQALLFRLTTEDRYRVAACAALENISLGYREKDPPSTSVILRSALSIRAPAEACA